MSSQSVPHSQVPLQNRYEDLYFEGWTDDSEEWGYICPDQHSQPDGTQFQVLK